MDTGPTAFNAGEKDHRLRIDRFLTRVRPDLGRSEIERLLRRGAVQVGGVARGPGYYLKRGDSVRIDPVPPVPTGGPRRLVASRGAIAVGKPPGMPTNPTGTGGRTGRTGRTGRSLLGWLEDSLRDEEGAGRPGIVHRLDRDTSGIVLFSLTPEAHIRIEEAFRQHTICRRYLALVRGPVRPRHGRIEQSLVRDRSGRTRPNPRGQPARTDYRTLRSLGDASLLEVQPRTGRTHQVRVHLAAIGHPVAADPLYGDPRSVLGAPRLWLHAISLEMPRELAAFLELPQRIACPLWKDLADHLAEIGLGSYDARKR